MRALVFGNRPDDRSRAGRTLRGLRRAGALALDVCGHAPAALAEAVAAEPVWLVRAGAWPAHGGQVLPPPPSDTGMSLIAFGSVSRPASEEAARWDALLAETGGDFSSLPDLGARLPPLASVFLAAAAAAGVSRRLARGDGLAAALAGEIGAGRRVVRHAPLDVCDDSAWRVVQVVTSLQRGGAERVTLDLSAELPRLGVCCLVVTLGRPTRAAFLPPPGTLDLSRLGDRPARAETVARAACAFGADLVHGHLLDGEDAARLSALGLPLVLTVHNTRPGWPDGLAALPPGGATLLVACARAVEADLAAARLPMSVRTIWNGIDFAPLARTPALVEAGRGLRRRLGLPADALVLLSLANPRPQKRLHLLPAILAATRDGLRRAGVCRDVHLLLVGEASRASPASRCVEEVRAEAERLGVADRVCWAGSTEDVAPVLAAADVLVSTSSHEGLSLAQLEALAAGLPVVATDVGGAAEVARDNPAVALVPADAPPARFADALLAVACRPADAEGELPGRAAARRHFTRARMAERYAWLYPRAVAAARRRDGSGIWLVANNFSTGGAQSSARRLLLGLAAEGIRVRAAVLQEQPDRPTPGRRALTAGGVPVLALPPAGTSDAAAAVAELLRHIEDDPPQAVLLWNALAEYKVLLADGLLGVPLFDVSPGEMYFASLDSYFARPRPGLPYRTATEYGARLAGVIVKYRAEAARAAALGAPVHVIPNGVPLDRAPVQGGAGNGRVVIGTAARLSPQKKLEELLAALHRADGRMPPYVLRIAGGPERGGEAYAERLRRLADGLPVEWVGEVADGAAFLRGLDLFAMVSEPAGCPNASLEAMAAGLAVVATDVGGAAEQIEDGVTGRLVPPATPAMLAEALVELARDPARRATWGGAGRARVAERFSLRAMVANYRRVCLGEGLNAGIR